MQVYRPPVQDMRFALELFGYEEVQNLEKYADYDVETLIAMLEETAKFAVNEMLPLNQKGDREGLKFDPETGEVTTPEGFKALYKKFVDSGIAAINYPIEFGGGGAPHAMGIGMSELSTATNKSFSMCPGLNSGLAEETAPGASRARYRPARAPG